MKEKLEAILRTLEKARRQVSDAMESNGEIGDPLEEIEIGLEWIKKKLEKLKDSEQTK